MATEVLSLWRETQDASGRDAELGALLRELDEARQQARPRFVFVSGPAGVGKSHLLGMLRAKARAQGRAVFEGDSPREARRPFGLFATLLRDVLEHLGHGGYSAVALSELARRLSPIIDGQHAHGAPREGGRLELFEAVADAFSRCGGSQPLYLFPDLDAADESSLELFRYLAAVVTAPESETQGLFVGSFRNGELPRALSEVLGRVSARTLSLGGLDLEGIRAFLLRREVAQKLYDATGGLPDALEELLTRRASAPVDLFLRRVAQLPDAQRALLGVLSVSRDALPLEVLAAATGAASAAAAANLDALVRDHVLSVRVSEGRPVYRFTRDGEKAAFRATLAGPERAQQALADALIAAGQLEPAAHLLLEIDGRGRGVATALEAAERLWARGAVESARELYGRALPLTDRHGRAALHARLSEIAASQGDFRQALRHLGRSRPLGAARSSREARAEYAEKAARYLVRLGRLQLAERVCTLARQDPRVALRMAAAASELALLRGHPDRAVELAREALAEADLPEAQRIALRNALGKAQLFKGDFVGAQAAFEQNLEAARGLGDKGLVAQALVNQGVIAARLGERDRAIALYQAGLPDAQRPAQAQGLANLGSIFAESGDFEQGLSNLSRALQAFSRLSAAREVAHASSNLARLTLFLGDVDRAVELSEHALTVARDIGEPYLEGSALLNLGQALIDRREPHDALKLLDEARTRFEAVGARAYAALACALKARAHLDLGERAQASAELSRKLLEGAFPQLPAAALEVELVRAELQLHLGDLLNAGKSVARARDLLLGRPELEGPYRVYFLMGKLRLAAGDTSGAQAEMARSARLLDEVTQRVPPSRRMQFLSVPRRAQVLSSVEPELRLPKLAAAGVAPVAEGGIGLVGKSPSLGRIVKQIEPIARANTSVLVRGESGTGKELLAEAIHNLSPRRGMPLVKVNCAAMVEELLLSELFGHEKGAFTGAVRERKGRFELADGGTLFLDEIGDISPKCQVALLRVLQEREFERVGGTRTLKVDVRLVCATNRDLETLIAQGRFRQDLYYRLKGVMLELPPLRARLEDLTHLAAHFLGKVARERGEAPKQLSAESLELLCRHDWPGNVRELENVLASAAIFADGQVITPEAFAHVSELAALMGGADLVPSAPPAAAAPAPAPVDLPAQPATQVATASLKALAAISEPDAPVDFYALVRNRNLSLKELRHELEMQCIQSALGEAGGNISEAARLLKMKRSRLSQIVNAEPTLKAVAQGDLSEVGDD